MNPAVDVIVDRDDDIATVNAIHSLAVRQRGVLVIHIAPATREEPAVVWAILRALGKRIERLDRPNLRVFWMDAERWLTAHRVREIVVLCAQHLGASVTEELKAHVSGRFRLALALIYSGRAAAKRAATTTLDAYLGKPRHPPQPDGRPRHWPQVPRSDPLRFRYDCWRQLAPKDFARVEGLLSRSMTPLSGWRASTELAGALTASSPPMTASRPTSVGAARSLLWLSIRFRSPRACRPLDTRSLQTPGTSRRSSRTPARGRRATSWRSSSRAYRMSCSH